jgi:hypothetical protein
MGMRAIAIFWVWWALLGGQALGQSWPKGFEASYGFELIRDHDSRIIVYRVDTLSDAYAKGIRPGVEVIGWNQVPLERKLKHMRVRKFRDHFPGLSDEQIRLALITRGKPGESAEVFLMTGTGNNRGIRITIRE